MASTEIDVPLPTVMPDGPDGRMHRLLRGCERLAAASDDSEGLSAALAECCLALPSDVAVDRKSVV